MRKSLLFCTSVLVISSLLLVSCKSATPEPTGGKTQIVWFFIASDESVAAAREFVARFNVSQDQIELTLESSHPSQGFGPLDAMIGAGNSPDVLGPIGYGHVVEEYSDRILDLKPVIPPERLTDIDPTIVSVWTVRGKLVGVPFGSNPSVLYYNKDLFDAAGLPYPPHVYGEPYADGDPWTVEKLEEIALQLTLDTNGNNATSPDFNPDNIQQYGFHWQWVSGMGFVNMFGSGDLVDADGRVTIPDRWRDAYHWYYAGIWEKHFIPSGDYGNRPRFESGRMAMVQNQLWYLPVLRNARFNWDIAAIPSYEDTTTVYWGANVMTVLKSSRHPQEAAEIAYTLANSPELLAIEGNVPAFRSLQPRFYEALSQRYPGVDWQAAQGAFEHLSLPLGDIYYPEYDDSILDPFEDFRDRISTTGGLDLDAEIDQLESDVQRAVRNAN